MISLGCAKNTVDSASMAELLRVAGYQTTEHSDRAGVIIVNTCGFIGPARDESYQVLAEMAAHKRKGQLLIAAGCLTQRYGAEVVRRVPGIDGVLGTRRWMDIVEVLQKLRRRGSSGTGGVTPPLPGGITPPVLYHLPDAPTIGPDAPGVLRSAVQGGSAYIKIADGCRRPCAFCAIPLIKGTAVSRPMEAILQEARLLGSHGVREINLIAQDTTDYGHDLGLKDGLAQLLEALTADPLISANSANKSAIYNPQSSISWIRILYAYPGAVSERLIEVMARQNDGNAGPQIVHYLDMPLQHAHPDTLRRMRRPANVDWVYRTLEKMRRLIPDLALRTTFIIGYPGETEEEFQALLDFVKEMRFDRVGTFQFSFEAGTPSEPLGDPISPEVKQERYDRLMELQQGISLEINQSFVGKTLPVLIEGLGQVEEEGEPDEAEVVGAGSKPAHIKTPAPVEAPAPAEALAQTELPPILIGRSYRDAPEIDGVVLVEMAPTEVSGEVLKRGLRARSLAQAASLIGKIVPVRITGAMAYDLHGILNPTGGFDLDRI